MEHRLDIKSIAHAFGKRQVLSDISFTCTTGEVIGIFGRNGTGKSTLLKILFGTMRANQSEIYVDGQIVSGKTELNRFIGYHHQDVFLPKYSTVRSLIPLYFPDEEKHSKLFGEKQINKIEKLRVGALSAGEQRFLQFLMVINLDHYFVLLDEPFSMLEPLYKELVKEKITAYKSQKGFIITDHYFQDVLEVATTKKLINDGVMKDIGTTTDLVESGYLPESVRKRI